MRRHCSLRSSGVSAECSSATFCPKAASSRPTICGVSPISGTSRIDDSPRSSARCIAAKYTAVFPDPVTPCSKKGWNPPRAVARLASASICGSLSLTGPGWLCTPPRRKTAGRSSIRTSPRRTSVCNVEEGKSFRRNSASGSSPSQAASSARIACCLAVNAGSRASGISTANRSIRRASRSAAAVSRAIHFLRVSPASTGSVAAVAVRSVETFTGSPEASRSSTRRSRSCSSAESFPFRFGRLSVADNSML